MFLRFMVLELMMFVSATMLRVTAIVGATVLVEASVIVELQCSRGCVLELRCWKVDPESVGDVDSRNRTGAGRCEKSSSNCKHICMYILRAYSFLIFIACGGFFLLHCGRRFFLSCDADRLTQSIIYGFFLLHLRNEIFYAIAFNKDLILVQIKLNAVVIS
jgi:hypothetical protein